MSRGRPFREDGKNFVFVQIGERFEPRDVQGRQRTESRAVITGLHEGDQIALVDPDGRTTESEVVGRQLPAAGRPLSVARCCGHLANTDFLPDFRLGLENLRAHKLRSLLTMLGMIFGVAAVVAMLSIGAGAQQEVMAFIEQLGVRNMIVEAREATDCQALQKVRKMSPGLTVPGLRVIQANVDGISAATARKRFTPPKLMPRPAGASRRWSTASARPTRRSPTCSSCPAASSTRPRRPAAAPVAVLGEGRGGGAVRRRRSGRPVRQGQRAVVPGDRRRRARS